MTRPALLRDKIMFFIGWCGLFLVLYNSWRTFISTNLKGIPLILYFFIMVIASACFLDITMSNVRWKRRQECAEASYTEKAIKNKKKAIKKEAQLRAMQQDSNSEVLPKH